MKFFVISLSLLAVVGASPASVLFRETFHEAAPGQQWSGYGGWTGSSLPVIERGKDGMMIGVFPEEPTDAAAVSLTFEAPFDLRAQGYRFSFGISGYISRQFEVSLCDGPANRIGLQFSDPADSRSISGVSVADGAVMVHTNGGWQGGPVGWPPGFKADSVYRTHFDINGTSSALDIGGQELDAGKVRITYNADGGEMGVFIIEFDLPAAFASLSGILISKPRRSNLVRSVGDFELQAYPARQ